MLKKRVVAVLPVLRGRVVQSIGFDLFLPVGRPEVAVDFLNRWGIDEIILLDISACRGITAVPVQDLATRCAPFCQAPLTIGGGIRSLRDIQDLVRAGADKVAINSAFFETPELVTHGANLFGSQCMVVSIDVAKSANGTWRVVTRGGTQPHDLDPVTACLRARDAGAGEILITSVDRDGSKTGYDVELIHRVASAVSLPVIACGGAGHPDDFWAAARAGASAMAAGNYFHFTEHSVNVLKSALRQKGLPIRNDVQATYDEIPVNLEGRLGKLPDAVLERLRFEYIPEEVI